MDLLTELRQRLEDWDIHCIEAMPNVKLPRLTVSGVFLGILKSVLVPRFGENYLYRDDEGVAIRKGMADVTVFFDIYTPYRMGAPVCEIIRERVRNSLLTSFNYYTVRDLTCGECYYDPKTDYFRCRLTLTIRAWIPLDNWTGGLS